MFSDIPVDERLGDTKAVGHALDGQGPVRFQQLGVGDDPHFANVELVVRGEDPVQLERFFDGGCGPKFRRMVDLQSRTLHLPSALKNLAYSPL